MPLTRRTAGRPFVSGPDRLECLLAFQEDSPWFGVKMFAALFLEMDEGRLPGPGWGWTRVGRESHCRVFAEIVAQKRQPRHHSFFQPFTIIFDGNDKIVTGEGGDDSDQHFIQGQFDFFFIIVDIAFKEEEMALPSSISVSRFAQTSESRLRTAEELARGMSSRQASSITRW